MAKDSDNILERARKQGFATPSAGMAVPEGYFASFARHMEEKLPERPDIEGSELPAAPRTFWQQVRPYVYMAAMFAGIWLMLQMFAAIGGTGKLAPVDDNPVLAKALSSDEFVFDYVYPDITAEELVDDMIDGGEIDEDFGFEGFADELPSDDDITYYLP